MRHSVRFRIVVIASVSVAIVLTVASVTLVITQRRQLTNNLDQTLRQRADDLAAAADDPGGPLSLANRSDEDSMSQIVGGDEVVLAASNNVAGLPPVAAAPSEGAEVIRTVNDLPLEDDAYRLLSRSLTTAQGPVVIHVAENFDDVDDSTAVLIASLAVIIPITTAMLAGLIWWLVGRTLRPVDDIRREVADIGATALDRRVPRTETGDEIDRLAQTMNSMLDRLEAATHRQQRFVADASHELRSPLTRMKTELDIGPTDRDSVLEEVTALESLVDDLLHLASSDAGATESQWELTDLDDIVLREARRLRARQRVGVDQRQVSAAQVWGDPAQLTRAVRNLLENSQRHAESEVTLALSEANGVALLVVTDDGPGIPIDQHDNVFERFTRLDESRSRDGGGTGLGLAIAKEIIERHNGVITIDAAYDSGARFLVSLPASPDQVSS